MVGNVQSWTHLETLGNLLYTYYFIWFLVPSLILLVAMIGALVPTMHRTTKMERQGIFRQNPISFRRTRISSYMAFLALQEAPNLFYQYHQQANMLRLAQCQNAQQKCRLICSCTLSLERVLSVNIVQGGSFQFQSSYTNFVASHWTSGHILKPFYSI